MWQQAAALSHQIVLSAGAAVLPIFVLVALLIRRRVAGSLKTKVQGVVSEMIPPTASAEMHRKMSEPGSGEK